MFSITINKNKGYLVSIIIWHTKQREVRGMAKELKVRKREKFLRKRTCIYLQGWAEKRRNFKRETSRYFKFGKKSIYLDYSKDRLCVC